MPHLGSMVVRNPRKVAAALAALTRLYPEQLGAAFPGIQVLRPHSSAFLTQPLASVLRSLAAAVLLLGKATAAAVLVADPSVLGATPEAMRDARNALVGVFVGTPSADVMQMVASAPALMKLNTRNLRNRWACTIGAYLAACGRGIAPV